MIDRTIPFYNIILKCESFKPLDITLPKGYNLSHFKRGYEKPWAKLEHELGDFNSIIEAEKYFFEKYMSDIQRLKKQSVFLLDSNDEIVGFCLAWTDNKKDELVSSVHWLAVDEKNQGKGLGKFIFNETMKLFDKYPVYIHTQPWSWKAILLYISMGFRIQKTDTFADYTNQYDLAVCELKKLLSVGQFEKVAEVSDD